LSTAKRQAEHCISQITSAVILARVLLRHWHWCHNGADAIAVCYWHGAYFQYDVNWLLC